MNSEGNLLFLVDTNAVEDYLISCELYIASRCTFVTPLVRGASICEVIVILFFGKLVHDWHFSPLLLARNYKLFRYEMRDHVLALGSICMCLLYAVGVWRPSSGIYLFYQDAYAPRNADVLSCLSLLRGSPRAREHINDLVALFRYFSFMIIAWFYTGLCINP